MYERCHFKPDALPHSARRSANQSAMLLVLIFWLMSFSVQAQTQPDAGRVLQDTMPQSVIPPEKSLDLQLKAQQSDEASAGGPQIQLKRITVTGNTLYSEESLLSAVNDAMGQSYDLTGLRGIANRITEYYRDHGYPFARAYIPEQSISKGTLAIAVVEGRYGQVAATGDTSLTDWAQPFLKSLTVGSVISSGPLERSIMILDDQPGINVAPSIRPGADAGTGDLDVQVNQGPRTEGQIGTDNHGNRYSGEYRANADVSLNHNFMPGDEVSVRAIYTNEDLWLGQLAYSRPLGDSGLRGQASYTKTDYALRAPYQGYSGTAEIGAMGSSYPLIRSQRLNLMAVASGQYKNLNNELQDSSYDKKSSWSWPVGLQFDCRDNLGGSAQTYGNLMLTLGHLNSSSGGVANGAFTKGNVYVARIQSLPSPLSLFTSISGQWSDTELDSSESFILGGANAVRAYPQGEGSADKGLLGQIELRYALEKLSPYLFYDTGWTSKDAQDQNRTISGTGIGLRYSGKNGFLNASTAWKTAGGEEQSDDRKSNPRFWFSVGYRF
ncbi:MAG: ShlB/FhaC/HecB family hemolysin secretion/activation protein [Phycisphaeraceae bacterium]|nr:ShlB/FhaC/HecB family hemolysin secretion/activation protein [Phycisphaeraceae bacterium]